MIRHTVQDDLIKLIADAAKASGYEVDSSQIILEVPRESAHGDFATTIALKLSKKHKTHPQEIAQSISDALKSSIEAHHRLKAYIDKIEVKSGFINFYMSKDCLCEILKEIHRLHKNYGRSSFGEGKKLLIEFVSANPTGPLSVAHGRQAAIGDSLARVLKFAGYKVAREYLINDAGRQIELLGRSIWVRYQELFGKEVEFPQDGYQGEYITDIAKTIKESYGDRFAKDPGGPSERPPGSFTFFAKFGYTTILKQIKHDLADFGVRFNSWMSESALRKSARVDKALEELKQKNYIYSEDGASWFKSSEFGDQKDRVVVKSDGSLTYLAPDIAYHQYKFQRGYQHLIDIWGPDHHGYIGRLRAAVEALGKDKKQIDFLIVQLCTLYRGEEQVRMSTRAGEFVTLRQILDDVGKDAARFFFLMRKVTSHLDFDMELAKKKSLENPVYYIQYAHARICSIFGFARQSGFSKSPKDLNLLSTAEETKISKTLSHFPNVVLSCAKARDPYGLTPYLQELAASFHSFYDKHRVVTDDTKLSCARLYMLDSVRIVLSTGLGLLGLTAPSKM